MQVEVTAAINLIAASLYHKLPRRRVDAFAEELEKGIITKFQGHWYPDNPSKGAAYRCINVSGEKVDPVIIYSVINSGLDIEEVNNYLPKDLTIWIDPGEVSFSIGEKGQVRLLYSDRRPTSGTNSVSSDETPTPMQSIPFTSSGATSTGSSVMSTPLGSPDELTSNLSSSFGNLSLSSGGSSGCQNNSTSWSTAPSPIPWSTGSNSCSSNPWSPIPTHKPVSVSSWSNGVVPQQPQPSHYSSNGGNSPVNLSQPAFLLGANQPAAIARPAPVNNNNKTMTAAMFAQTKFGSTKLKTHGKRSNRLSPTENFTRALNGANSYGQMRPNNHTMNPSLVDRMHAHMHPHQNNMNDFPIDYFKMSGSSSVGNGSNMSMRSSDRYTPTTVNQSSFFNFNQPSTGNIGRNSPCNVGTLAGMLGVGSDQDWIDLTDLATPSHQTGNQLLAA